MGLRGDDISLAWEDYNKLLPIVLLLLLVGLTGLTAKHGRRSGSLGRVGLVVALFGLGLMLLGNVGEFWIAGGIRVGLTSAALVGWMSYSLGIYSLVSGWCYWASPLFVRSCCHMGTPYRSP